MLLFSQAILTAFNRLADMRMLADSLVLFKALAKLINAERAYPCPIFITEDISRELCLLLTKGDEGDKDFTAEVKKVLNMPEIFIDFCDK
jgi:hypothetical protein